MGIAQLESVSASLIDRAELPAVGIVALDVVIDGETVAIIVDCREHQLSAWRNVCPHQGRRLDYVPGKFLVDGEQLICAAHGAMFRLDDGVCVQGPCRGSGLQAVAVHIAADGAVGFG